jgi:hypothetical protein
VRLYARSLTPEQEALVRAIIAAATFIFIFASFSSPAVAQNNPVPFLNNPTVPGAIAPGEQGFTLKVNGAGFVNGATLMWNGSPRTTTLVSAIQLTAAILTADVATPSLVSITVSNPSPGGGVSNPVLFSVTTPATSLAFTWSESEFDPGGNSWVSQPMGLVAGSNPTDGTPVLVVADGKCPPVEFCSNDNGTIAGVGEQGIYHQNLVESPQAIVTGDFNGDGVLDVVTLGQLEPSAYPNPTPNLNLYAVISPGATSGPGFQPVNEFSLLAGTSASPALVVGDFNRDGHLDIVTGGVSIATGGTSAVYFLPGNGDGTLGTAISSSTESTTQGGLVAGDFNGDGILDLAVTNPQLNTVSILLGNGDGTFMAPVDSVTGASPGAVVTGDFNGDGKLDLAVLDGSGTSVSILLGNGDGTFKPKVEYPAGFSASFLTLGDFNGDGILDIALSDTQCTSSPCPANGSVNILLGNVDGTFQSQLSFAAGGEPMFIVTTGLVAAASPSVGRAGVAVANFLDNTVSIFSPLEAQGGTGNPVPVITSISPANALQGSGSFTLTVNGSNFIQSSTLSFGGQPEQIISFSASQLTANIPASAIATAGPVLVLVSTPAPDGGVAESSFAVFLPPPTISSITPSTLVAGSPGFTLTINGTNFVNGSTVNFNGVSRAVTFVSPTQITTSVLPADVVSPGIINVFVANPLGASGSAGATSTSAPLTVLPTNSQPTVGALSPASTTAGGQLFTLTITGTGFAPASVVTFGSQTVIAAYQSPTVVQAAIPASAIAVAGTPLVIVANPGSLPSTVVSFTVNNPVPQGSLLSPASAAAGSAALNLNVTGSNFNASSTVLINGTAFPTTYVSTTLIQAAIPASGFAQAGTLNVSVMNPPPGGGTSSVLQFIVDDYAVNTQTTSETVTAGQPAPFSLVFAPSNGTYSTSITLAATGLPTGAKATFLPSATIPAGSPVTPITMQISTTSRTSVSSDFRLPMAMKELTALVEGSAMFILLGLLLRFSLYGWRRPRIVVGVFGGQDSIRPFGTIAMVFLLFLACICGFQQGCGITSSPSAASAPQQISSPTPINIAGNWTILSTSTKFVAQRTFAGPVGQNGSSISGSLSISGSPCAQTGTLTGTMNASSLAASLVENGQPVSLAGTVSTDGNSASGSYTAAVGGCTNGDAGTWSGTRSATGSNPGGTPAGTYTITVTGTSGTVSHSTSVTLTVM